MLLKYKEMLIDFIFFFITLEGQFKYTNKIRMDISIYFCQYTFLWTPVDIQLIKILWANITAAAVCKLYLCVYILIRPLTHTHTKEVTLFCSLQFQVKDNTFQKFQRNLKK